MFNALITAKTLKNYNSYISALDIKISNRNGKGSFNFIWYREITIRENLQVTHVCYIKSDKREENSAFFYLQHPTARDKRSFLQMGTIYKVYVSLRCVTHIHICVLRKITRLSRMCTHVFYSTYKFLFVYARRRCYIPRHESESCVINFNRLDRSKDRMSRSFSLGISVQMRKIVEK